MHLNIQPSLFLSGNSLGFQALEQTTTTTSYKYTCLLQDYYNLYYKYIDKSYDKCCVYPYFDALIHHYKDTDLRHTCSF